jgi:hypothetical protein
MFYDEKMKLQERIFNYNKGKEFRFSMTGEAACCIYDFQATLNVTGLDWAYFDETFVKCEMVFTNGGFLVERV